MIQFGQLEQDNHEAAIRAMQLRTIQLAGCIVTEDEKDGKPMWTMTDGRRLNDTALPGNCFYRTASNYNLLLDAAYNNVTNRQWDQTNWVKLADSIWVDLVYMPHPLYFYTDETTASNGPFATQEEAEEQLGLYVYHMLQEKPDGTEGCVTPQ